MLQNQFIVGPPFMMGFPGRNHSITKSFDGLFFFKVNLENIAPIYDLRKWFFIEFSIAFLLPSESFYAI